MYINNYKTQFLPTFHQLYSAFTNLNLFNKFLILTVTNYYLSLINNSEQSVIPVNMNFGKVKSI